VETDVAERNFKEHMNPEEEEFFRRAAESGEVRVAPDVYELLMNLPKGELGSWNGIRVIKCEWLPAGSALAGKFRHIEVLTTRIP